MNTGSLFRKETFRQLIFLYFLFIFIDMLYCLKNKQNPFQKDELFLKLSGEKRVFNKAAAGSIMLATGRLKMSVKCLC